jgi:hypothetical protein
MSPDKARQIGDDLAHIAASIAEIAEELKAMSAPSQDAPEEGCGDTPPAPEQPKPITMEQVRAVLAEKSRDGYTAAVKELILRHGANKLSEVIPTEYAALLAEAEGLG